ncbi:MAG: PilZ domain-containing protein [Rubrivivax sp.]|nr:PilZ domain-containing protein [Pyrinomonadaceae bacterium]
MSASKEIGPVVVVDSDSIMPVERRQHERITTYLRARWEGLLGCYEGTLSDISAGGCFILSDVIAAPNELLRLDIELHSDEWVKVWGEVTNCFDGIGFGIRYTEIDEEVGQDGYDKAIGHTRALKTAVAAMKKFDAAVIRRSGSESASILVSFAEYKSLLLLALPRVNKGLLSLPECRKKSSIKLSVQAYVDASRAWAIMSKGPQTGNKQFLEMTMLLKDRYDAPPDIIAAFRQCEHLTVLNHLWVRAYIYLAFAT